MRKCIGLVALLVLGVPAVAFAQHETPGTIAPNLETVRSGSLIIAMDNDKQNIGSLFNVASYGLVIDLLMNNIPVKWAIRTGKAKDGVDFTATASRIAPSALGASSLSFSGGPFIVDASYANLAKTRITAFGRNVAVYQTTADVPNVDIRYDILFKPRPFINTTNSGIISGLLDNAGITAYTVGADFSLDPNQSCYTILMEPHNSVNTGTGTIRNFLTEGGNFYAQCLSTVTFENAPLGFFMSSNGIIGADTSGVLNYPNPDLAFSQLIGAVNPAPGGSVEDWKIDITKAGNVWRSGTTSATQSPATPLTPDATGAVHYAGMMSKFRAPTDTGGVVFYVGGHNYSGTALMDLNGQRLMFNAILIPARRPGVCNIQPLNIPVSDMTISKSAPNYFTDSVGTFSFSIGNIGDRNSVDSVFVTDTLPVGLQFKSGTTTGGTGTWSFTTTTAGDGRTIVRAANGASIPSLGGTSTFTITVRVTPAAIGTRTNTAYVVGGGETNLTNDTSSATVNIVGMSGRVFEDFNLNGVQDAGDPGFSNLDVIVSYGGWSYTAKTDSLGNWIVAGLPTSTLVTVTVPTTGNNAILTGATLTTSAFAGGTNPSNTTTGTSGTTDAGKDGFGNVQTNIQVTKTGPAKALVGDTVLYVITTTNAGLNAATGVVVSDTLPAGVTFVSASRGGTASAGTVTWPSVTLNVGSTLVDSVRVAAPLSISTLLDIAAGTTTRFDTSPTNNNGSSSNARVSTQLTIPDLSITKTHTGYFTMGAPGFYTITVTNGGTGPARNVVVTDTLPSGFGYDSTKAVSGNWSFARVGQVVTASVTDSIAPSGVASFNVYVTPTVVVSTSPANATVNNTARVTSLRETTLGNNSVTDPTQVRYADLTITKTAGTFVQGQPSVWTITVTNSGTGPTTGLITVADTVGPGQTSLTPSGSGWNFTTASPVVTGTYAASLAPGATASFTLTVTPGPTAYPTATNTAVVSGGSDAKTDNNSVTATASLAGASDLKITKTASSTTPFVYGTNATYSIKVDNIGAIASSGNIVVTDTLPAGMKFVSGANVIGTGWAFAPNVDSTVVVATYTGTPLAALTGTTTFSITALVLSKTATVKNIGRVSGGGDGTPGNNADSVTTAVTAKPDVTVYKTAAASFTQGTNATYTIVVKNVGAAATTANSIVTDSLPAGVSYVSRAVVTGSWGSFSVTNNVLTGTLTTTLAPGDSAMLSITVTPLAAGVPSVTNKVSVSNTSENYTANNKFSLTTPVTGLPDLSIVKTSPTFVEGSQGTYRLVVKNIGTWPTSGVITVLDTLPTGTAYASSTIPPSNWTIGAVGQVVTATSSPSFVMQVGDSAVFTITVNVQNAGSSITNRGRVAGGGNDPDLTNNVSQISTTVTQQNFADLTMTKTSSTFTVGQTNATYTLTVTNVGSVASSGAVTVVDTLPAGISYVSGSGTGWTFVVDTVSGRVRVTATAAAPNIKSNATSVITLTVSIGPSAFPSKTNTAWVSGGADANPANNSGSVTTAVSGIDLAISKTSSALFTPNTTGSYTLQVKNLGNIATTAGVVYTVVDTLPVGLSLPIGASTVNTWSLSVDTLKPATVPKRWIVTATRSVSILAGDSTSFTISPTVSAAAIPSVYNRGWVSGGGQFASAVNDSASVTTPVAAPNLTIAKTTVPLSTTFNLGDSAVYRITVKNIGNAPTLDSVVVTDALPTGLTYVSASPVAGWTFSIAGQAFKAIYKGTAIAAGDSSAFTIKVNVGQAAYPSVTNSASVSGGGETNTTDNGSGNVTTTVNGIDLAIVKRSAASFTPGTTGTYTIKITNVGTAPTFGQFNVVDTLPVGFAPTITVSGTSWSSVIDSAGTPKRYIVTATRSVPIAATDSALFTITGNVTASIGSSAFNRAWVSGGSQLPTATNDSASVTTSAAQPNLTVKKVATATDGITAVSQFNLGDTATYRITVKNIGGYQTTDSIMVTDTLPAGLTYLPAGLFTGWTFADSAQRRKATYKGTPIAPNDSAWFTIKAIVGAAAYSSVTNRAWVAGGGETITTDDGSGNVTTTVNGIDLALTKTSSALFTPGTTGTYTLSVKNIGQAKTFGTYTVVDTLAAGLTLANSGPTTTANGWTINVTNPATRAIVTGTRSIPLAVNDTSSFSVTPTVTTALISSVYNRAWVSGGTQLSTPLNDSASVTTPVATPDLKITKVATTSTFDVGVPGAYSIKVKNIGNYLAAGPITVRDTLPAGLTYLSASGTGWSIPAPVNGVVIATYAGNLGALGTLPDSAMFTINVSVGQAALPNVTNRGWVSGPTEKDPTNDSASVTTNVGAQPDLQITKTANTTNFTYGAAGGYTVTVANVGTQATLGTITVVDTLASGLIYVSASGTGWSISQTANVVTATYSASIAISASAQFTISVTVGVAATSVGNTARVSGGGDSNTSNNTSTITTPIIAPDLTVAKVATNTFQLGQNGTYQITVNNIGTAPTTTTFTVVDTLRSGLTYVSGSGTGWTFGTVGQVVTATYSQPPGAALAAGSSTSFILTVAVGAAAMPTVQNSAVVSGGGEWKTDNDTVGPFSTTVGGAPNITVLKGIMGAPSTVLPGTVLTYSITFTNGGTAPAVNVIVTDDLPTQVQFKIGSISESYPAGITAVTAFYNGAVTYTPVSGGCGAPTGFDGCVTKIQWSLQSPMANQTSGVISLQARVK